MVGVSTACLYPLEVEKSFEYLAENGVKNTEVFFNTDSEFTPSFASELKRIADDYGMRIYSVHPYTSNSDYFYLYCDYPRRQRDAFDMYRRFFDITASIGAEIMNFHGPRKDQSVTLEKYCERYMSLFSLGREYGVDFCQENVSRCHSRSTEFISEMSEYCGDNVRFTLDIKQAHRADVDPFDMSDAMKGKIRLVHCNDFDDEHSCLLPLCGKFDIKAFYSRLTENGYNGMYTVEVYSDNYSDKSEVIESYRKLCNLLD